MFIIAMLFALFHMTFAQTLALGQTDVPYCDAFPDARAGWLDKLKQDMKAPDALGYYPPPAHLMRPVSPPGASMLSGSRQNESNRGESDETSCDPSSSEKGGQD